MNVHRLWSCGWRRLSPEARGFAIVLGAATVWLFGPALRPGAVVYGVDTVTHNYPALLWAWGELAQTGRLPLWCPHLFTGLPTLGTLLWCPFHPTQALFAVAPFATAFTLQFVLAIVWAGAGTWTLARRWGLSPRGALVAGLAFALSGHLVSLTWAGHLQKTLAIAWLPWALAGWTMALRERRRATGALVATVAVAMQLLASHPQIAAYTVGAGLALALAASLMARRAAASCGPGAPACRLRPVAAALILVLATATAGAMLAGAQTLPLLETSRLSIRAGGVPFDEATATSFPPGELAEIVLPRFSGDNVPGGRGAYWGRWGDERIVSDYAGAGVLLAALAGLALSRRRGRWFWLALWLGACALALGRYSPLYRLAYDVVPAMDRFRSPGTIMVLMAQATAMLAGLGVDALLGKPLTMARANGGCPARPRLAIGWRCAALAGVTFIVVGGTMAVALHIGAVADLRLATGIAATAHTTLFAGCALVAPALAAWRLPKWSAAPVALLAVVIAVDLVVAHRVFVQPTPVPSLHAFLTDQYPDAALANRVPPARVTEPGGELINRRMVNRVSSLHGYHPVTLRRYHETLGRTGGFVAEETMRAFAIDHLILTPGVAVETPPSFRPAPGSERLAGAGGPLLLVSEAVGDGRVRIGGAPAGRAVQWRDYGANHLALRLEAGEGGSEAAPVTVAEPFLPGWRAFVGGAEVPLRPDEEYGFFRTLDWDGRPAEVAMRYEPFSFRLGLFLSLLTGAALVGVALARR